jgi:hypothetical protein
MAPESRTPASPADMAFDDEQEQTDDRSRMSFLEHLDELRKRIL